MRSTVVDRREPGVLSIICRIKAEMKVSTRTARENIYTVPCSPDTVRMHAHAGHFAV
jgi:hypothetical protein